MKLSRLWFALTFTVCGLLIACTGSRSIIEVPSSGDSHDASVSEIRTRSLMGTETKPDFLYYIRSDQGTSGGISKVALQGSRKYRRQYGADGPGLDLAIDKHRNVYEAFGITPDQHGVGVLDHNLNVTRIITVPVGFGISTVAVDGKGKIYAGVFDTSGFTEMIWVFAPNATGMATPIRTISGPKTGLVYSNALAVDSQGYLYVVNATGGQSTVQIAVFGPQAKGDPQPVRVVAGDETGLTAPIDLALGADGNMYVANQTSTGYDMLVFPASANGNVAPLWSLQSTPYGAAIALGAGGLIYLAPGPEKNANEGIAVFSAGASGNDAPIGYVGQPFRGGSNASRIALEYPWYLP